MVGWSISLILLSPPLDKGKEKVTISDLATKLDQIMEYLHIAIGNHVRAIEVVERLDTVTLSQANNLRNAVRLIKYLLVKATLTRDKKEEATKIYQ